MTLDKPKLEHTVDAIGTGLIDAYQIKTLRDTKEMYFYSKNGLYEPHAEEIIEDTVRKQVDRNISKHDLAEILYYVQTMTYTDRSEFDKDSGWLHCGNGWVCIETKEFLDNSPDRLSLFKIPHTYDPAATNPEQLAFFEEIFEEEDLDAVQKFFGYLLLPDQRFKKAFVGVGPKDTGKSKFAALVEAFAGPPSHVSLHDMGAYRHNVASITKSIVNTTSELSKYSLKDVGLFKGITGGDELSFREIYGKPFNAKVRAKFLMVSNELPDFEGMDQTFIDRWIVFRFSNIFKQGEDMDVNILDKLTTAVEMSGLINYAIEGLGKLLADGFFKNEEYADVKAKWDTITSKLGDYKEQHCEMDKAVIIPAAELFNHYQQNGGTLSKAIFGREIKNLGVVHKQMRIAGKPTWVYEGITIKGRGTVTGVTGNIDSSLVLSSNNIEGGYGEFPVTAVTPIEAVPN